MPVAQILSSSGDKWPCNPVYPPWFSFSLRHEGSFAHYWSIKAFIINDLTFLLDPMVLIMLLWGDHWIIMEAMTLGWIPQATHDTGNMQKHISSTTDLPASSAPSI